MFWNKFEMKQRKIRDTKSPVKTRDIQKIEKKKKNLKTNNSLKNYGLCPIYCLNARGLSWDGMLIVVKVELERISDPDMHIFFEKGMRGGVYYISNR